MRRFCFPVNIRERIYMSASDACRLWYTELKPAGCSRYLFKFLRGIQVLLPCLCHIPLILVLFPSFPDFSILKCVYVKYLDKYNFIYYSYFENHLILVNICDIRQLRKHYFKKKNFSYCKIILKINSFITGMGDLLCQG